MRKAGVLFVALLVGAVCALIQGSGVVDAAAEDRKLEDVAACWVTGLPATSKLGSDPKESYGGEFELVVDFSDLQDAVVGDFQLEPDLSQRWTDRIKTVVGFEPKKEGALFRSLPGLVDYAFYLRVDNQGGELATHDLQIADIAALKGGARLTESLVPWEVFEEYMKRRPVATWVQVGGILNGYKARWVDPDNPGGGLETDQSAVMLDRRSTDVERVSGTVHTAGGGSEISVEVTEQPAMQGLATASSGCLVLGTCSFQSTNTVTPMMMRGRGETIEQNNEESHDYGVGRGEREKWEVDDAGNLVSTGMVDVDNRVVQANNLDDRAGSLGGYAKRTQADTGTNEIHVELRLKSGDREDYGWDVEAFVGKVQQPGFGFDPWTYERIGSLRDPSVNRHTVVTDPGKNAVVTTHNGYRQPTLSRAYGPPLVRADALGVTRSEMEVVKWPVNLEDVHWFLYELPGKDMADPRSWLWLEKQFGRRLVHSGYGTSAKDVTALPDCFLEGEVVLVDKIKCWDTNPPTPGGIGTVNDWDHNDWVKGRLPEVYLPFDVPGNPVSGILDPASLVRSGVASARDAHEAAPRNNSEFSFVVEESVQVGGSDWQKGGVDVEKRYGVPKDGAARDKYLKAWPAGSIDPRQAYLLVVTFYQSLDPERTLSGDLYRKYKIKSAGTVNHEVVRLPGRKIRRVVCRLLVHPSGFSPAVQEGRNLWQKAIGSLGSVVTGGLDKLGAWAVDILGSIAKAPVEIGRKAGEVACQGLDRMEQLGGVSERAGSLRGRGGVDASHAVDKDGRVIFNAAVASRRSGIEDCQRVADKVRSTCEPGERPVVGGRCMDLPVMKIEVDRSKTLFVDPPPEGISVTEWQNDDSGFLARWLGSGGLSAGFTAVTVDKVVGPGAESPLFLPVRPIYGGGEKTPRNVGLTSVKLDWGPKYGQISEAVKDGIDGYIVWVIPDPKTVGFKVPSEGLKFVLPEFVVESVAITEGGMSSVSRKYHRIEGVRIGSLDYWNVGTVPVGSNALVDVHVDSVGELRPMGSAVAVDGYKRFVDVVGNLPLTEGFSHSIAVVPYVGNPDLESVSGMPSETDFFVLDGSVMACDALMTAGPVQQRQIAEYYDCGDLSYLFDDPAAGVRFGLLDLTGSPICHDIFSSVPAWLTWENPIVRHVWLFMWIIAGGVFFALLLWQGVRMTFDVWIDPRPSIGVRELVPRFMMALILAAGSLLLCQLIIVVTSDLTCWISQMTGMSMWGVVGLTFGEIFQGYFAWMKSASADSVTLGLPGMISWLGLVLAVGLLVLVMLLFVLILFVKVCLAMVLRIAQLAVLTSVSPVAFAFYASDSTSHWTKTWLSMFIGAAMQQMLVLIVIYLGGHLLGAGLKRGTENEFSLLIMGLVIGLLTLALADRVPAIVNPSGSGLFSSFKGMMQMAVAGAVMTAGVAVGAVGGGLGAAMGSASSVAGGGSASAAGGAASTAVGGVGQNVARATGQGGNVLGGLRSFGGLGSGGGGQSREDDGPGETPSSGGPVRPPPTQPPSVGGLGTMAGTVETRRPSGGAAGEVAGAERSGGPGPDGGIDSVAGGQQRVLPEQVTPGEAGGDRAGAPAAAGSGESVPGEGQTGRGVAPERVGQGGVVPGGPSEGGRPAASGASVEQPVAPGTPVAGPVSPGSPVEQAVEGRGVPEGSGSGTVAPPASGGGAAVVPPAAGSGAAVVPPAAGRGAVQESGSEPRAGGLGGFIPLPMIGGVQRPAGGEAGGRSGGGDEAGAGDAGQGSGEGAPKRGFFSRLASVPGGMVRGGRRGVRVSGGVNTRLNDVTSGSFLFRGRSTGDDAMRATEQQTRAQKASYDRLAEILLKIEGNQDDGEKA